jgi:hypothetical protein
MAGKSRTPLFLGCGSCLSFLIGLAMLGAAAYYFKADLTSALTEATQKQEMQHYKNTREGRTGNLAASYVDFEFDYPKSWTMKAPDADAVNFVAVSRTVDGKTYENLNVGYFKTAGSTAGNEALYPQLVEELRKQFAEQFSGLTKVHEGKTKVGQYDGYEGLFTSTAGTGADKVDVYTRVILLPTPDGSKGVTLLMLGTSASPDLHAVDDVGKKGDLPSILDSFRFSS